MWWKDELKSERNKLLRLHKNLKKSEITLDTESPPPSPTPTFLKSGTPTVMTIEYKKITSKLKNRSADIVRRTKSVRRGANSQQRIISYVLYSLRCQTRALLPLCRRPAMPRRAAHSTDESRGCFVSYTCSTRLSRGLLSHPFIFRKQF